MGTNWKKNTAIFLGSQMISLFGSALVQYAITWHITLTTQSGFYMMLSIVCGFVPTFLLSPFAGVWADRYNRKVLVMLSDASIAVTTLILALMIWSGYDAIWLLFVALGIRALGAAVQMPCVGAILPSIVPTEHLTKVNGINGSLQSLITLPIPDAECRAPQYCAFFQHFFHRCGDGGSRYFHPSLGISASGESARPGERKARLLGRAQRWAALYWKPTISKILFFGLSLCVPWPGRILNASSGDPQLRRQCHVFDGG